MWVYISLQKEASRNNLSVG